MNHRLPLHSVNHQERLSQRLAEDPTRITGATIVLDQDERTAMRLYSQLGSTYTQLIANLRISQHIGPDPSMIDDFSIIGLPRAFVTLDLVETVDLIVSVRQGVFTLEIFLNYKGKSSIEYETAIHTGLAEALREPQTAPVL